MAHHGYNLAFLSNLPQNLAEVDLENYVKSRRLELGLTVRKLAEVSEVPASTISTIETGKREPGVATAIRLARALCCKVDDLFIV